MNAISAVLIVRDEADRLEACLAALRSAVDEIVVVDTGSRDATPEIAARRADRVAHFPWCDDFAAARNFAVSQARHDWALSVDADEMLDAPERARAALAAFFAHATEKTLGTVEILNLLPGEAQQLALDRTPRLFHRGAYHFSGAIHEQLTPRGAFAARSAPTGLRLRHSGYAQDPQDPKHKARRNLRLLDAALLRTPEDEYLHYQRGKALFSLGDYGAALRSFEAAIARIRFTPAAAPTGTQGPLSRSVLTGLLTTAAYALCNLGRHAAARQLLQQHRALGHAGTRAADFHHALGYACLMLGDIPAARAAYTAALGLPEDVLGTGSHASEYHLGLLCEAAQDLAAARQHYLRALEYAPDYAPARARLEQLGVSVTGA